MDFSEAEKTLMLLKAVEKNNISKVISAIKMGVNLNIIKTNISNTSPLHLATLKNYLNIVKILLQHHADIHMLDPFGDTPLHVAAIEGNVSIAALLLEAGAHLNINKPNIFKKTPLQYACIADNIDMIYCFLCFMSTEQMNTAITLIPSFEKHIISFKLELIKHHRHLYAIFGSCAVTADKIFYPQGQPLELLAKQIRLCFPFWYEGQILKNLKAIFNIPYLIKQKAIARVNIINHQNVDALIKQKIYTPSKKNNVTIKNFFSEENISENDNSKKKNKADF